MAQSLLYCALYKEDAKKIHGLLSDIAASFHTSIDRIANAMTILSIPSRNNSSLSSGKIRSRSRPL